MSDYTIDMRDVRFVLHEVLGIDALSEYERFQDFDGDVYDMVLDEAYKLAKEKVSTLNEAGDREGCRWEAGEVKMPSAYHDVYRLMRENNWIAVSGDQEWGGTGLPKSVAVAVGEMFTGACCAMMITNGLTVGAAELIREFGSDAMKKTYLEKMYSGEWAGTMCLTEDGAGSDVGASRTKAFKKGDHYLIEGTKVFISSGEQDLTENIIHLVLARTENAPKSVKGLSLFLIPKYLVNEDGSLGERNGVFCPKIEEKLGIHGSPTCVLDFGTTDDKPCVGYLLGEELQGIQIMFHMMNEARLDVGLQGLSIAGASFEEARAYAKERIQGPNFMKFKDPETPRVPIIEHPDVRRMLMFGKAYTEAMRALIYTTGYYADLAANHPDKGERGKYFGLLELLTPICKAWGSDMGFRVTETSLQVYGGYGYIQEYPAEQYLRDAKIASIYEGTNGIQAMDLVARKVAGKGGIRFMQLLQLMNAWIAQNKDNEKFAKQVKAIDDAKNKLAEVTFGFMPMLKKNPALLMTNMVPYLLMFGDVVGGFFLLQQALIADAKLTEIVERHEATEDAAFRKLVEENPDAQFYFNKVKTVEFYIYRILPQVYGYLGQLTSGDTSNMEAVL